jgi:hypothetical protein
LDLAAASAARAERGDGAVDAAAASVFARRFRWMNAMTISTLTIPTLTIPTTTTNL